MSNNKQNLKIAVVGDVHDQWDINDHQALHALQVDLVLFVGDFGNESWQLVKTIASLDLPKAVIFGNHDSWYSATDWGRKKSPYDRTTEDWVQRQIDILGNTQVGYGYLDFPQFNLSVVGSRPFSWGGSEWKYNQFYRSRYGVNNFVESTNKIVEAGRSAKYDNLIMIGHNGPLGLGDRPESICGRDWEPLGGDYGDPDFREAIDRLSAIGKSIPLITFGHMHHRLRHTQHRLRDPIIHTQGRLYLNAARCPRVIQSADGVLRNFSLVTLTNSQVSSAKLVWVNDRGKIFNQENYL
jgi:uncharacterized protein (TIGR04168 family)